MRVAPWSLANRQNRFMQFSDSTQMSVLNTAINIAEETGRILADRPESLTIATKTSETDVVTHMDELAEAHIVKALEHAFPDDGILGEEGAAKESQSGFQWVIDPLDGTINYLYKLPAWAVSIARVDLHSGRSVIGVVCAPALESTYFAASGLGAFKNNLAHQLQVGSGAVLSQSLIGTGFSYQSAVRAGQARVLSELLPKVRDIRRIGSCAIDLCFVAEGKLDAFYERKVNLWDHAAGSLIARESGAKVSGLHQKSESYEMLVASNPVIYADLVALLEDLNADSDSATIIDRSS